MATHTKRDRVWTVALELACRMDEFAVSDVFAEQSVDDPAKRTVRDVLMTMAAEDWLQKTTAAEDGRRLYGAGEKLDEAAETLSDSRH